MANVFRIVNAIILWLTVIIFLPRESFKKYLAVTLFCSNLLLIQVLLNFLFKWWTVKGGPKFVVFDSLAFIFGPFMTINLWVFHFTYKKFWLYALANLVMDLIFAYPLNALFQRIGHYKLNKFTSLTIFLIFYSLAMVNYGFQKIIDKLRTQEVSNTTFNT
ncbi:hypothetical protein [Bacillus sp. JCM 19034]|uniref:hypothetical protein n=1 Tax=Bacillus sp. JCM 19034 TaxID=1481928 RepID=UPI0007804BEB|nr:hypothetical protein [Bacillus sp. JCM 19034]